MFLSESHCSNIIGWNEPIRMIIFSVLISASTVTTEAAVYQFHNNGQPDNTTRLQLDLGKLFEVRHSKINYLNKPLHSE